MSGTNERVARDVERAQAAARAEAYWQGRAGSDAGAEVARDVAKEGERAAQVARA